MNRKISRLARGVKCGARGASGLLAVVGVVLSQPASANTVDRPSAPIPPPMRHRTSRRDSGRFTNGGFIEILQVRVSCSRLFTPLSPCGRGGGGEGSRQKANGTKR